MKKILFISLLFVFSFLVSAQFDGGYPYPGGAGFDPRFGPQGGFGWEGFPPGQMPPQGFDPRGYPGPRGFEGEGFGNEYGFGGPQAPGRSDFNSKVNVAPGVDVNYGPSYIPPEFNSIDEEDMVMAVIGPIIFNKIGDPEETLAPLCPDVDKIAQRVSEALDESDFENMCVDMEDAAARCDNSVDFCEEIKARSSGGPRGPNGEEISCPVDNAKLVDACKNRLSGNQQDEDAQLRCENAWEFNEDRILSSCRDMGRRPEFPGDNRFPPGGQQPPQGEVCPQAYTCPDGSTARGTSRTYQMPNGRTCPMFECGSSSNSCPSPASPVNCPSGSNSVPRYDSNGCVVGYECRSSGDSGNTSSQSGANGASGNCMCPPDTGAACSEGMRTVTVQQQMTPSGCTAPLSCPVSHCEAVEPPADQPPANGTQSTASSRINTLVGVSGYSISLDGVFDSQGGRQSGGQVCNKEAFMAQCLSGVRQNGLTADKIERICQNEAKLNRRNFDRFCQERERFGDPYERCVESSSKGCAKVKSALSKCKEVASRDKVIEYIKQKARVECKRYAYSDNNEGRFRDAVDLLERVELEDGTQEDNVLRSAARDKLVLTDDELDKLKAEIKADVLKDLMTLLGFNKDLLEGVAEKQKREIDNLKSAKEAMAEICGKAAESAESACETQLAKLDRQIAELEQDAAATDARAGGIMGIISALFKGS